MLSVFQGVNTDTKYIKLKKKKTNNTSSVLLRMIKNR